MDGYEQEYRYSLLSSSSVNMNTYEPVLIGQLLHTGAKLKNEVTGTTGSRRAKLLVQSLLKSKKNEIAKISKRRQS